MRTRHLEVAFVIAGHAVSPVRNSVVTSVDGRFLHRSGQLATKGRKEIASTASGIAGGKDAGPVFLQNLPAHGFGRMQDGAMNNRAPKRRRQSNDRRDVMGRWDATERAMMPPRLCPIRWIFLPVSLSARSMLSFNRCWMSRLGHSAFSPIPEKYGR